MGPVPRLLKTLPPRLETAAGVREVSDREVDKSIAVLPRKSSKDKTLGGARD